MTTTKGLNVCVPQKVIDKIEANLNTCDAGAFCFFIPITDSVAVKCYPDQYYRDVAYERQQKCYDEGLAPEAFEEFDLDVDYYDDDGDMQIDKLYCYTTEIIEPCVKYGDESACNLFEYQYEKEIWQKQVAIERASYWYPHDAHGYNWGWNEGKLQLLDFS